MKPNNLHLIGATLCIIFINIALNNKSGEKPAISINIYPYIKQSSLFINDYHIHHWILCTLILLILLPIEINQKLTNPIISMTTGFLAIFMIHGLSYKDRFQL
tara:strand:+ start:2215 stop:2523 length:309 start_codon:yes stop_codon:yes gene_type:complete